MTPSWLQIRDLTLTFAGVVALDAVSLDVPRGSISAIIGPNGAGKTSLFNCVSGLYRPSAGTIAFAGCDLLAEPTWARARIGIARMFQNLALYPQLSVLDNLMVGRHHLFRTFWWQDLLATPAAVAAELEHREAVERIIDFLDLEAHRGKPAGVLPYGVLKRVELGRALAMEPSLLLLDEPAAGLNQEETEDMARYLIDAKEDLGVTLVLIEHDLHFVMDLADEVTVLDFGRLVARGSPSEVRANAAVVAAYVGAPP